MSLIAITGKIGSGKSTVASYLVEKHGYVEVSFASALKKIGEIFWFSKESLYGSQEDKLKINEKWGISGREFLQKVGTEMFRNCIRDVLPNMKINYSVWIDIVFLFLEKQRALGMNNFVISDLRFEDEAKFVKDQNGVILKIIRPELGNDGQEHKHASESSMDKIIPDFILENNSTLDDLFFGVEKYLNPFYSELQTRKNFFTSLRLQVPYEQLLITRQNELQKLIEFYPDKDWDWRLLAHNPCITWNFIKNNKPDFPYFFNLSSNISLTKKDILELREKLNIDMLNKNLAVTQNILGEVFPGEKISEENPNKKRNVSILDGYCERVFSKVYFNSGKKYEELLNDDNTYLLSSCPKTSLKFIEEHPEIKWDYKAVSFNPNLTLEFVQKNPDKNWCFHSMSRNIFCWDNTVYESLYVQKVNEILENQINLPLDIINLIKEYL